MTDPVLCPDHKTNPNVDVAYIKWPNPALKGRIAYLQADVTWTVNDMFINKNKISKYKRQKLKVFNDM